jgi:hypothetical protein
MWGGVGGGSGLCVVVVGSGLGGGGGWGVGGSGGAHQQRVRPAALAHNRVAGRWARRLFAHGTGAPRAR